MKAIEDFETMFKECLEAHREENPNKEVCVVLNTIITYDLEQLKEQLKEQHKEGVVKAYDKGMEETQKRYTVVNHSITAEQYYQQTHEKK